VYVVGDEGPVRDTYDRELPIPLVRAGEVASDVPSLEQGRERLREALVSVPWEGLKLSVGEPAIPTTFH
jgi:nicotinate phosphoribosyltransferase